MIFLGEPSNDVNLLDVQLKLTPIVLGHPSNDFNSL